MRRKEPSHIAWLVMTLLNAVIVVLLAYKIGWL